MATIPAAELNASGDTKDGSSEMDTLKESRKIDAVLSESAPDLASTLLMLSVSHSLGLAAQNAVAFQQASNILANAVATMCATTLLAEGAAAGIRAVHPEACLPAPSAVALASLSGVAGAAMAPAASTPDPLATFATQLMQPAPSDSLAFAPTFAAASLCMAISQAMANAAHNATTAQQQTNVTAQAATTMGVATLYSIDTAATGIATQKILNQ